MNATVSAGKLSFSFFLVDRRPTPSDNGAAPASPLPCHCPKYRQGEHHDSNACTKLYYKFILTIIKFF